MTRLRMPRENMTMRVSMHSIWNSSTSSSMPFSAVKRWNFQSIISSQERVKRVANGSKWVTTTCLLWKVFTPWTPSWRPRYRSNRSFVSMLRHWQRYSSTTIITFQQPITASCVASFATTNTVESRHRRPFVGGRRYARERISGYSLIRKMPTPCSTRLCFSNLQCWKRRPNHCLNRCPKQPRSIAKPIVC